MVYSTFSEKPFAVKKDIRKPKPLSESQKRANAYMDTHSFNIQKNAKGEYTAVVKKNHE